jgi:hypothetical protein
MTSQTCVNVGEAAKLKHTPVYTVQSVRDITTHAFPCDRTHSLKTEAAVLPRCIKLNCIKKRLTRYTPAGSQHCTNCVLLLPTTAVPRVSGGGSYLSEQGDKAAGGIAYCTVRWNSDRVGRVHLDLPTTDVQSLPIKHNSKEQGPSWQSIGPHILTVKPCVSVRTDQ